MSDLTSVHFVSTKEIPASPPPSNSTGIVAWVRQNLFSNLTNSILTVVAIYFLYLILPGLYSWGVANSVVFADSIRVCREAFGDIGAHGGACWGIVTDRWGQFMYGFYPEHLQWRPNLALILLFVALTPILYDGTPKRGYAMLASCIYPFIAVWLIWGGFGLEPVKSESLGGFTLTFIIGVTGIVCSFPLGILLALGRQSNLIFIKTLCVVFIEFIRGVPLITLLFVASTLLNYFLPKGTSFDILLRVNILVTFFAAAYMAEVIRGGLAALPRGQYEAADALGLTYWVAMWTIILPQALKITIPGIVNTFIGLFKDTTLVSVIGLFDPIGIMNPIRSDTAWNGIVAEPYVFVAVVFFICCFGMSRYSAYMEKKLDTGNRS